MVDVTPAHGLAIFINTLIVVTVLLVTVLSSHALRNGRFNSLALRRYLLQQRAPVRLERMLERRHVNVDEYLSHHTLWKLGQHAQRCRNCSRAQRCEDVLASAVSVRNDYAFCPNSRVISPFVRHRQKAVAVK